MLKKIYSFIERHEEGIERLNNAFINMFAIGTLLYILICIIAVYC